MNKEIKKLENQVEELKEKTENLKKYAVVESIIGAVITTIFVVCNILQIAAVSFAITLIISFIMDVIKKILTFMIFKKNKLRNNLIVQDKLK